VNDVDYMRLQGFTWAEIGELLGADPTKIRLETVNNLYKERYE